MSPPRKEMVDSLFRVTFMTDLECLAQHDLPRTVFQVRLSWHLPCPTFEPCMSTSALIARREWHPLLANLARSLNRVTSLVAPPPSSPGTRQHKVVVIHVHPYGNQPSFTLALTKTVRESLEDAGHEVRVANLYEEGFQSVMGNQEHRAYLTAHRDGNMEEDIRPHVENLRWCSALVFCYPTWWYSFPAILKGWFDRIFIPGVAFDFPNGVEKPNNITGFIGRLKNVEKVGIVTTFGNNFWNVLHVGDPGRRIICRGLRPLFHPDCTVLWKGLYNVEGCSQGEREGFLRDVKESFSAF